MPVINKAWIGLLFFLNRKCNFGNHEKYCSLLSMRAYSALAKEPILPSSGSDDSDLSCSSLCYLAVLLEASHMFLMKVQKHFFPQTMEKASVFYCWGYSCLYCWKIRNIFQVYRSKCASFQAAFRSALSKEAQGSVSVLWSVCVLLLLHVAEALKMNFSLWTCRFSNTHKDYQINIFQAIV